jgi:hypothetical protein
VVSTASPDPLFHGLITTIAKDLLGHYQRTEAISECIDAGSRLRTGSIVRPNDIESTVDVRNSQSMKCRVAESKRSQVIRVIQLLRQVSLYAPILP